MGSHWLRNLPTVLGPHVGRGIADMRYSLGWETRARSSGGLDAVDGCVWHHTASPPTWDGDRDANYIATGADTSPISQLYISRRGIVYVLAAGAANHAGRGGPLPWLAQDMANRRTIGVEMGNAGTGEPWPRAQLEAAIAVGAALTKAFGWTVDRNVAHKEWCGPGTSTPGRKIDPLGPWQDGPAWPIGSSWGASQGRIDLFRACISRRLGEPAATAPDVPTPTLRAGSTGQEVRELQAHCQFWGWYPYAVDGSFGPRTADAVRKLQAACKVTQDAIYGPITADAYRRFLVAMAGL